MNVYAAPDPPAEVAPPDELMPALVVGSVDPPTATVAAPLVIATLAPKLLAYVVEVNDFKYAVCVHAPFTSA